MVTAAAAAGAVWAACQLRQPLLSLQRSKGGAAMAAGAATGGLSSPEQLQLYCCCEE